MSLHRLKNALEIKDLYRIAEKTVPRMFFQYADSGSWTESTYRLNELDWEKIKFRQRILTDISNRDLGSEIIGQKASMPVVLSPVGMCGLQHADGEILSARSAEKFGVPFTLSTMSICSIESVASQTSEPFWFQMYMLRDRKFMEKLIERAINAKCSALVLTLDLQILGQRHKDIRNELSAPPKVSFNSAMQVLSRPRWCLKMLGTKNHTFGNIVGHATGVSDLSSLSSWTSEQFDPKLSWKDVEWVKKLWPGKLILKGIMDVDDAKSAVQSGADAIVVSNHGGRQLDGAPSSISALYPIVQEVGSKIEIHVDGGIRSGQDVLRALSLGAKSCHIGRPYIYGLGAAGEAGVTHALEIIQKEMDVTLALLGETDVNSVGIHNISHIPEHFLKDGIVK